MVTWLEFDETWAFLKAFLIILREQGGVIPIGNLLILTVPILRAKQEL